MARNPDEEKWEQSEEEEEEEALSLCDLPVSLIKEKGNQSRKEEERGEEDQEEFDFGSCGGGCSGGDGLLSTTSEMCAADDIFFQGQILPFRLSVSSENDLILNKLNHHYTSSDDPSSSCLSRSVSMDHSSSSGGFNSFSSRRSSQLSSSSTGSSTIHKTRISNPRKIQILENPGISSPKPQIRLRNAAGGSSVNRNRKSTVWDIFRPGLVRTPEIELQDLKVRTSVSRNSSSSSSSNTNNSSIRFSSNSSNSSGSRAQKMEKQEKQSFLKKKSPSGALLSGCSCRVSAVKLVALNIIIISNREKGKERKESMGGKLQGLKIKNKNKNKMNKKIAEKQEQQLEQKQKQGKQAMSRHRTFEWIKELSHASFPDHEEGLDS